MRRNQWEQLWVVDARQTQVNVQLGPVEVIFTLSFDLTNLVNGGRPKPWEILKTEKMLTVIDQ